MLTQERLKELLHYDPETGIWTWIVSPSNKVKVGAVAGSIHNVSGYRILIIDSRSFRSGRLAHLYMTSEWPIAFIDHINGDRADDRWINLRSATHQENQRNRRSWNQTGVKCVYKTPYNKFRVLFKVNGKNQDFGTYDAIEEATAVAAVVTTKLHGEFAASNRTAAVEAETEFMEAA